MSCSSLHQILTSSDSLLEPIPRVDQKKNVSHPTVLDSYLKLCIQSDGSVTTTAQEPQFGAHPTPHYPHLLHMGCLSLVFLGLVCPTWNQHQEVQPVLSLLLSTHQIPGMRQRSWLKDVLRTHTSTAVRISGSDILLGRGSGRVAATFSSLGLGGCCAEASGQNMLLSSGRESDMEVAWTYLQCPSAEC